VDQHLRGAQALPEGLGDLAPPVTPEKLPLRSLGYPFGYGQERRRLGVRVQRNIAYGDHPRRNLLDIYTSAATPATGAPVLLEIHGGGWTIGNKQQQALPLLSRMAAKGWVGVTINYRLAPRHPWPAQIVDVKRAIAWIKENIAEYGGDPDHVVITGGSAGGHLSALAALTPNDPAWQPGFEEADTTVQAAVPHYGVYDFAGATGLRSARQMRDHFLKGWLIKEDPASAPEVYEAASPILRITPDAPDFFVLHGDQDTLVRVEQARMFVERLREVSRSTVSYAEFRGAQHAFDLFPSIRSVHALRAVDRFLTWHHESRRTARQPEVAR
jgi:acetyl esterase/lipase